jgi:hypothetical protein
MAIASEFGWTVERTREAVDDAANLVDLRLQPHSVAWLHVASTGSDFTLGIK